MNEIMSREAQNLSVGAVEVDSQQLAEIKGKIFMARQFPRNVSSSIARIMQECGNAKLAENAVYEYKRGDSVVRGASIRLAEVIARNWGNFVCGVTELEQRNGESVIKAYAWDLETNTCDDKIFTVKHERKTKKGSYKLTDPRDIYEMVANSGTRRKRACIFAVIPSYIVDEAIEECEKTLHESVMKEPIEDVRAKILELFSEYVPDNTKDVLSDKVGKDFDSINAKDVVKLRHLYSAIKDGFVKPQDAFPSDDTPLANIIDEDDEAALDAVNQNIPTTEGEDDVADQG